MDKTNKNFIQIAKNHNKKCIVCGRKSSGLKLRRVSSKTISMAFLKHKIFNIFPIHNNILAQGGCKYYCIWVDANNDCPDFLITRQITVTPS